MANERWLKKPTAVKNVSQSDVRRIQIEKEERQASLDPPKTTLGGLRPPKVESPAPMRDFHKVANSINREAVPAGLFPGSCKKLYDAIYMRTRGAVVPVKSVQATRRELSKWSGIKNIKTIASHLRHLSTVGLLIHGWDRGSTEGSTYEVLLPEEIGLGWSKTTLGTLSPPEVVLDQKLVLPLDQKLDLGGLSQVTDSQTTSGAPKTSFKTSEENLDDDAARAMVEAFLKAERELTGKNSSNSTQWRELAEVLIAELKIAAGRTTISSVPAFMAEHLRRRLWKIDKKQAAREGKELPDQASVKPGIPEGQTCADCSNTGWWYPNGAEKGVARCAHLKLESVPAEQRTE